MGARAQEEDAPVVEAAADRPSGPFSPAMLGALAGAVVLAVVLAVFIVTRLIAPRVEQNRVLKEEMEQMGTSVKTIIGRIKQYPLQSAVVNVAGTNAERYLKVTIVLGYEYEGEEAGDLLGKELETRSSEIRSQVLSILQTKELKDLDSQEGREAIRRELLNRINAMLVSGRVVNVYYTEFVVQ